MEILLASFAALVAGFVDAIAGGGGVITFPTFLFLGLPISQIVGTNKLVSTAGTSIATLTFIRQGYAQKDILRLALPCTFIGALLGAATVLLLPNEFLKPVVSILVICVALYCFFRPALGMAHSYAGLSKKLSLIVGLAAFSIGFYDGFFGPGTGIFLTFFFISIVGCDFLRATANTKALNWMSNITSLIYFVYHGHIRYDLGVPMLFANMVGGYFGAHTAIAKGSRFIKWLYLVMAFLTAAKLIGDFFNVLH